MTEENYDCTKDVCAHIINVQNAYRELEILAGDQIACHDQSKLESPEKEAFDAITPKLRNAVFGTEGYKKHLDELGPALQHHYENNRHHPEYYENGVNGMNLVDIIEMLCDWKAACERNPNGDLKKSLEINKERFNISDQLHKILCNTCVEMGWFNK